MTSLRRWPDLYKLSPTGKYLIWRIWIRGSVIFTESGFEGQKMKSSRDEIKSGKNIGRSNETTPELQAELEAAALFKKYKERGYYLSKDDAKEAAINNHEEVFPMLAHEYKKHGHKLSLPLYIQPKLDGTRLIVERGEFLSRTRKPLAVPDTVKEAVLDLFPDVVTDGELYNHEFRHSFSKIISAVRTSKSKSEHLDKIQYHIYDLAIPNMPFVERRKIIRDRLMSYSGPIVPVKTVLCRSELDIGTYYHTWLTKGYEGAMLRDPDSFYDFNKRSYSLQKYKPVFDSEFRIVGIKEGRGKLAGAVGTFTCEIDDEHGKRTFDVKLAGTGVTAFLQKALKDPKTWKGKWMKVEYLGITDAEKVPRCPVGIEIRDVE